MITTNTTRKKPRRVRKSTNKRDRGPDPDCPGLRFLYSEAVVKVLQKHPACNVAVRERYPSTYLYRDNTDLTLGNLPRLEHSYPGIQRDDDGNHSNRTTDECGSRGDAKRAKSRNHDNLGDSLGDNNASNHGNNGYSAQTTCTHASERATGIPVKTILKKAGTGISTTTTAKTTSFAAVPHTPHTPSPPSPPRAKHHHGNNHERLHTHPQTVYTRSQLLPTLPVTDRTVPSNKQTLRITNVTRHHHGDGRRATMSSRLPPTTPSVTMVTHPVSQPQPQTDYHTQRYHGDEISPRNHGNQQPPLGVRGQRLGPRERSFLMDTPRANGSHGNQSSRDTRRLPEFVVGSPLPYTFHNRPLLEKLWREVVPLCRDH